MRFLLIAVLAFAFMAAGCASAGQLIDIASDEALSRMDDDSRKTYRTGLAVADEVVGQATKSYDEKYNLDGTPKEEPAPEPAPEPEPAPAE